MLEINGESYYLDLDEMTSKIYDDDLNERFIEETKETIEYGYKDEVKAKTIERNKKFKPKEMDSLKYEFFNGLINILLTDMGENQDGALPTTLENKDMGFTFAFNTLYYNKIIKTV